MEEYKSVLEWGALGLSRNPAIQFDESLLARYEDEWGWDALCGNEADWNGLQIESSGINSVEVGVCRGPALW